VFIDFNAIKNEPEELKAYRIICCTCNQFGLFDLLTSLPWKASEVVVH